MKPWYRKKKVWASILGAIAIVCTIFLAPEEVEAVEKIAAAILEAAVVMGFVFAESSIDKASAQINADDSFKGMLSLLQQGHRLYKDGSYKKAGFVAHEIAKHAEKERQELADLVKDTDAGGG